MAGAGEKTCASESAEQNSVIDLGHDFQQNQTPKQPQLKCPQCSSTSLYKDGLRYLSNGSSVQRWLCRNCGYRFTDPNQKAKTEWKNPPSGLNSPSALYYSCQGNNDPNGRVPTARKAALTLATVENNAKSGQAGATEQTVDIHGKIVDYIWHLKKKGLKEITVRHYGEMLTRLLKDGVNLMQPEEVKNFLARKDKWSERTKAIVVAIYNDFLNFLRLPWESPKYKPAKRLPFIPAEEELDQMIARAGKRLAPLLQILKETGMRLGEALRLKWTDVDFQRKIVNITPEKGSKPRILPLSEKVLGMLQTLPKKSEYIFAATRWSMTSNFYMQRKTLARKLNNPRILKISLHTFRHWKATMEYHKTKDLIYVQQLLGHVDIKSTMVYITIEQGLFSNTSNDEFHVKTARTVEEACKLAEVGFEYFDTIDGIHIYRRRK
ncbi:MAG: tyrosine-type recombinase/integrase [Candidatus Bathyarchaeia archaeon]